MMSVFWSNTLIFAPECWKYVLRGPVFKFFPEACAFSALKSRRCHTFFSSSPFDTYLILLKTLYRPPKTAILKLKIYWILHFIERNWKLISVMYVPQITICLVSIIIMVGRWYFFKCIYTPGECFPSRLFTYFTCNYLDKDKKFQMLVMTLRTLHNLVQKCVKKQWYDYFLIGGRLPLILFSFISDLYFRSGLRVQRKLFLQLAIWASWS